MIGRTYYVAVYVLVGVLGYALLAFGLSSRTAQVLGLPVTGMLVLAMARCLAALRWRHVRAAQAVLAGLPVLILLQGYGLYRIASQDSRSFVVRCDPALKERIGELVQQQSWQAVVELAAGRQSLNDPEVLAEIGYAHRRLGHASEARAFYQRAITATPSNPAPRYELARLCEETNSLRDAQRQYQEILRLDDSLPDVHFAYGALLVRLGDRKGAITHLEKAVELYPSDNPSKAAAQHILSSLSSRKE